MQVKLWISFNEPYQFCTSSYGGDAGAPALNLSGIGEYKCGHNILRAHAKIYHIYKEKFADQKGEQLYSKEIRKVRNEKTYLTLQVLQVKCQLLWTRNGMSRRTHSR